MCDIAILNDKIENFLIIIICLVVGFIVGILIARFKLWIKKQNNLSKIKSKPRCPISITDPGHPGYIPPECRKMQGIPYDYRR